MQDLSQRTILLVDDAEENLDILVAVLGDVADLTVATDGESALEILQQETPDLIVLDIEMPGMDGLEVFRRIKESPATARTPVVFLSAHSEEAVKARALAMGAVDFIAKPFEGAEVLARIAAVLRTLP